MNQELLINILTFVAAATPISLFASLNLSRIFLKLNGKMSKTTSICTTVTGVLTKQPAEVKTLFFDKYKARTDLGVAQSHQFKVLDTLSKLEIEVKRTGLQKDFSMNLMAITTALCHYEKMKNVEEITANLFKSCAIDIKRIQEEYHTISKIPTNVDKKISTVVAVNNKTKEIAAFTKGNPYKILEKCTRELIDGKKEEIGHQRRHKLKKRIEKMNKKGQKVIAFAYKALPVKRLEHYSEQFTESDLVLVGFIGVVETINSELIPYIEEIKKNNIKIYITTEVKEKKAVAIAEEMKIINPNYFEAIVGEELNTIDQEKLCKMLANKEKDYVFCETKPEHRLKIVEALEKNGETVNFASKQHGHSIKELLEHIDKSRKNKRNRGKLIAHALNSKIAQILLLITAIILQAPLPFSLSLIIAFDLFFNIILELALNTDKNSESQIINEEKIINPKLVINSLLTTFILGGIYFWNMLRFGWIPGEEISTTSEAYLNSTTLIFILLVIMQIITAFEVRYKEKTIFTRKSFSNIYLLLTTVICLLILQALTTYQPIQKLLGLGDLTPAEWQIIIFISLIFLLIIEVYKAFMRHLHKIHTNPLNENHDSPGKISAHQSHPQKL